MEVCNVGSGSSATAIPPLGLEASLFQFRFTIENLQATERAFGRQAAVAAIRSTIERLRSVFGNDAQVHRSQTDELLVITDGAFPAAPAPGRRLEFAQAVASTVLRMPIECGKLLLRPQVAGRVLADEPSEILPHVHDCVGQDRHGNTAIMWEPVRSASVDGACLFYDYVLAEPGGVSGEAAVHAVGDIVSELADSEDVALCLRLSDDAFRENRWSSEIVPMVEDYSLASRIIFDIGDAPEVANKPALRLLRGLGCRVALSGFGVGRSSFGDLLATRPDIVKVDGTLLRIARDSARNENSVRRLFELAGALAPEVVATGVDTFAQSRMAVEMGVEWQQGQFMGRPSAIRPWVL
ncbi:EAL domain-containing protein [Croceicoccus bisphenolivorans]|uniref:EAL domain-containing protein n=1 Tax=Croceicoccus bisphenolivorans TaxID=1783232 RepID=UPI000830224F|nr:EAL domain-containing protein [Croceicoccus bisphenolivorans]